MEKSLERVLAKESYDVIKKELYPIDNSKFSKLLQTLINHDSYGEYLLKTEILKIKDDLFETDDSESNICVNNNYFSFLNDIKENDYDEEINENDFDEDEKEKYDKLASFIFSKVFDNYSELRINRFLDDLFCYRNNDCLQYI